MPIWTEGRLRLLIFLALIVVAAVVLASLIYFGAERRLPEGADVVMDSGRQAGGYRQRAGDVLADLESLRQLGDELTAGTGRGEQGHQSTPERGRGTVSVVKVLELVGESDKSWQDAANQAVIEAARSVDNITGVEVSNWTAHVENGQISNYKANVRVAFIVDGNRRGGAAAKV